MTSSYNNSATYVEAVDTSIHADAAYATVYVDTIDTTIYVELVEEGANSGPMVFEVFVPGPPGSSAPVYAIRTDAATPGTVYVGRASVGSSEAATVWTIRRRTFSAAGVLLTTSTATGAWSNRTNLTYT